jgi:hypothetical protein
MEFYIIPFVLKSRKMTQNTHGEQPMQKIYNPKKLKFFLEIDENIFINQIKRVQNSQLVNFLIKKHYYFLNISRFLEL